MHSDNRNEKLNKTELRTLEEVIDPEGPPKSSILALSVNSFASFEAILVNVETSQEE